MAGTNILVRQKDLIAGTGISITPDTTSGNVTIAATNASIDESRLVPTGGKSGDILSYQEGVDQGNGDNVRLLLQNALTDSANGNAAPAAVTTQGVTLTGDNNLLFDGNDSHVTAVLATDEIFAADKEWTIDFWMKPTANSSEWNYILTENTGDWGSHSIGLTWNSDDSTLEQDTGGYLASVIRSSNWPNDAVACAADQWHFVVVEKQKTSTGWSLNYYLNGAIWLQVAFTGEFVPFDSSNPFWFGGKTTDSGRWFKGEANKLRVTTGARYGGKAFAVPDRLTDYAAPAGQPVWVDGIDRSRLLPEDPANGDIPCYSNEPSVGVNYNDANTVLLLQGSSDNTAAAPTAERLNGIVTGEFPVQADGSILVNGTSNYITFNDADARRVFSGEFTLETYIKTTQFTASGKRQDTNWCVVYRNGGSVTDYQWLLLSDFYADAGKFGIWPYPQMSGETFPKTLVNAEFQHVAIDVYMVDGVRKFTMYRNGVPYHTGNYWSTTPADWSSGVSAAMRLFGEGPSGGDDYLSNASVMSLRVSNIARYKGVSFDPPADGKYLNPPAGYWGKLNKSELVMKNSPRLLPESADNGDIPIFNATATTGGGNDGNTKALMHFDTEIKDEAVGNESPLALMTLNATIDTTVKKFGEGSLKLSNGHVFVPVGDLTDVDFVISCWAYFDTLPSSYAPLFSQDNDTSGSWSLCVQNGGTYMFCRGGSSKDSQTLQTETWYYFAVVKHNKELRFYLNGAYIYSLTDSILKFTTTTIGIGEQSNEDGRRLTGYVDEFRLQYLTAEEIDDWTGLSIPTPDAPYSVTETIGAWDTINQSELVQSVNGQTPDSTGAVTLPEATSSTAGLLSVADKTKLDKFGETDGALTYNGAVVGGSTGSDTSYQDLGSSVDFNTVTTEGHYFIANSSTHTNGPSVWPGKSYGGYLDVIANAAGVYRLQVFRSFDGTIQASRGMTAVTTYASGDYAGGDITFQSWASGTDDWTADDPYYIKFPNGTVIAAGIAAASTATEAEISLPVALSTVSYLHAVAMGTDDGISGDPSSGIPIAMPIEPMSVGASSFTVVINTVNNASWEGYISWMAIGII